MIKFVVENYIPSKKNETRRGKYGNWYNTKQPEIDAIILQFKSQKKEPTITENIMVFFDVQCKSHRQDLLNILNCLADCLEKAKIIVNDRQIVSVVAKIVWGVKEPITIIKIEKHRKTTNKNDR